MGHSLQFSSSFSSSSSAAAAAAVIFVCTGLVERDRLRTRLPPSAPSTQPRHPQHPHFTSPPPLPPPPPPATATQTLIFALRCAVLQNRTCTRPGPGFFAAEQQQTLCSNLMPVIPAPAGHGHSSARAPVRLARRRHHLRHAIPHCARRPLDQHVATCTSPTWLHGCLSSTAQASLPSPDNAARSGP